MKQLYLILACLFVVSSCKKDDDNEPNITPCPSKTETGCIKTYRKLSFENGNGEYIYSSKVNSIGKLEYEKYISTSSKTTDSSYHFYNDEGLKEKTVLTKMYFKNDPWPSQIDIYIDSFSYTNQKLEYQHSFDKNSNLWVKRIEYTYDAIGNLIGKYRLDNSGNRSQSEELYYDDKNRLIRVEKNQNAATDGTYTYEYNDHDSIIKTTIERSGIDIITTVNEYDNSCLLITKTEYYSNNMGVTDEIKSIIHYQYDNHRNIIERKIDWRQGTNPGTFVVKTNYTYDTKGNILTYNRVGQYTIEFKYFCP